MNAVVLFRLVFTLTLLTSTALPLDDPESPATPPPWPSLTLEELPEELAEVKGILELVPEMQIDEDGYLLLHSLNPGWERAPLIAKGPTDWESIELTAELLGSPVQWAVVLQRVNGKLEDDPFVYSHFLVGEGGVVQTKEPGAQGTPLVIWQLQQIDWDAYLRNGQPYVYSAFSVSLDPRFPGFDPILVELYETRVSIHRRSIVVKVDGELTGESTADLLGLLWALRRYGVGPWEIWDNHEVYGHNRDPSRDLGVEEAAKLRYLLGILTLTQGSDEDKELYFGPFLQEEEAHQEAVENYFASLRKYLMRVLLPVEMQRWDIETGYFFLHDALFGDGEGMPIAEFFDYPIPLELQTAGGYRHLQRQRDRKTDEEIDAWHIGEDFNIGTGNEDIGFPVKAIGTGRVVYAKRSGNGLGNLVVVRHRLPDGSEVYSRYAHLSEIFVKLGETVELGQVIGAIGRTGKENDPDFFAHLHLDLAYTETYERYLVETPWYYPDGSQTTVSRYFLDIREFIDSRLEPPPEEQAEEEPGKWEGFEIHFIE
ncbi:peptidoglycan DD-metalloendopeptidase family protein [Candidatus Saccharibacteria bacterium]|nr:peptidoglycan DD-metalloendopeptidase family protein [Candidatus Saccharibacteria bacterium]